MRERIDFIEASNSRIEPLFNTIYGGLIGVDYHHPMGSFRWGAEASLWGAISKLKNADPTPVSIVDQTATLAFGAKLAPHASYLFLNPSAPTNFSLGLGVPVYFRIQKFATSSQGTIDTKSLRILFGAETFLRVHFKDNLMFALGYGITQFDFKAPVFSLSFGLSL